MILVAAGCSGQATMMKSDGVTLTLGSALADGSGFVPLAGDQTLIAGAQGGFHVWVKYRVAGMAPATVNVHRTARRASDNALVLLTDGTIDVGEPTSAGYWELPAALPSFICPTPIGIDVIDQALDIDVTLSDDGGASLATASARTTVHCPTGDESDHCRAICSG